MFIQVIKPLKNIILKNNFIYTDFYNNNLATPILCWNRNPVARFPKKANHGALPKSHILRRIRKRLKTGR